MNVQGSEGTCSSNCSFSVPASPSNPAITHPAEPAALMTSINDLYITVLKAEDHYQIRGKIEHGMLTKDQSSERIDKLIKNIVPFHH